MARPHHHLADELERAIDQLDRVLAEVRSGIRGARHYDDLEARGQQAATTVVTAFRGSDARPSSADVVPGKRGGVWLK